MAEVLVARSWSALYDFVAFLLVIMLATSFGHVRGLVEVLRYTQSTSLVVQIKATTQKGVCRWRRQDGSDL